MIRKPSSCGLARVGGIWPSYTKIDDRILGFNIMKSGRITTSGRIVVSGDGKSRTVTTSGTDEKGHRVSKSEVYEKQ